MDASPRRLLPKSVLFELLPAWFEPWGSSGWYRSQPPTPESIRRIETALDIQLPPLLIEIAGACASYGGWFGSVGDDVSSGNHILSINNNFKEQGLPPRYVLLNHGHDGDCDAWDTSAPPTPLGERPIVYFHFDGERRVIGDFRVCASSFAEYLDAFVRERAPRCPVTALRRRAKRLLAMQGVPAID
jgi:hypothetical protein